MKRRKAPKRRKSLAHYLRGSATILILVIVVIIGSILLAGGALPKMPSSEDNPGTEAVIDTSTILTPGSKESLQLKTIKFKNCSDTITVDLLLDRSNSMSLKTPTGGKKIDRLKEAVNSLTNSLSDNSIIGIQSFNSDSITDDVPISFYKDVKTIVPGKINGLTEGGNTPTHDALAFSLNSLKQGIAKFPDRKFNFIFVSDGAPCPGVGCVGREGQNQDPRLFSPNPADEIKNLGVNVYALAIYDSGQSSNPDLAALMQNIASKPENYYEAKTADDTTRLLTAITEKICGGTTPTP